MRAMTNRSSVSLNGVATLERLAWPPYPGVMTTLLASIGVTTLFLGLSAITGLAWLTWVGLGLMAVVVGLHLWRFWQARKQRALAREQLQANLIGQCRSLNESSFLKRHNIGDEPLLLVLTDDALHLGHRNPLDIFATVPLYNVESAAANSSTSNPVLKLDIRTNSERVHTLALSNFEANAPATMWAEALVRTQRN
jgi:hypothetical protein